MKVIVNADDFGMSEMISKAIDEAFRNKWISQSTLMVNMPYADAAVKLAKQNGYWNRIGLHLNLTRGEPLTVGMRFSHFCDMYGVYDKSILTDKRMLLPYDKRERIVIEAEIRAQIEKFLSYQPIMMHVDGHQHLHTRLPLANIVLPLLKEYGFKSVRRTYSSSRGGVRAVMLALRNWIFMNKIHKYKLLTTTFFGGATWIRSYVARIKHTGISEVMTHPRYDKNGVNVDTVDYDNNTGIPLSEIAEDLMMMNCEMITFSDL